jgi:hypothetical protein
MAAKVQERGSGATVATAFLQLATSEASAWVAALWDQLSCQLDLLFAFAPSLTGRPWLSGNRLCWPVHVGSCLASSQVVLN